MDIGKGGRARLIVQLAVAAVLATVVVAGSANPTPAQAKVRISTSQARQQASQYIYKRAASSGRIYTWGVGQCRQLNRSKAACVIWWTRGVLKWAKVCKQWLVYRVDGQGGLWLTKFYPECRPRRG